MRNRATLLRNAVLLLTPLLTVGCGPVIDSDLSFDTQRMPFQVATSSNGSVVALTTGSGHAATLHRETPHKQRLTHLGDTAGAVQLSANGRYLATRDRCPERGLAVVVTTPEDTPAT